MKFDFIDNHDRNPVLGATVAEPVAYAATSMLGKTANRSEVSVIVFTVLNVS
jgi:hypothetical protein